MNVLIIGAGMAGSVASGAFGVYAPVNYDLRAGNEESEHKAVMRLRDVNVAKYLGVQVEPITVWKSVADEDRLLESADIRLNNLYSLKLYGELGERSLRSLGRVQRWLIRGVPRPRDTQWNHRLVKLTPGLATFKCMGEYHEYSYDVCISTIPMRFALEAAGYHISRAQFESKSIYVWTATVKHKCTLHQTIYFPIFGTSVYRATLQGQQFIIESIDDAKLCISDVAWYFGLEEEDFEDIKMHQQNMGKLVPIDEHMRHQYIYELTDRFNVYSLGRYAIWKPIRADHLVGDVEKIHQLASLSRNAMLYERNKTKASPQQSKSPLG